MTHFINKQPFYSTGARASERPSPLYSGTDAVFAAMTSQIVVVAASANVSAAAQDIVLPAHSVHLRTATDAYIQFKTPSDRDRSEDMSSV